MNSRSSRDGSALVWVAGVLFVCFLGFLAYHWYVNRHDHHEQDDPRVEQALKKKLTVVTKLQGKPGDWPQWLGPRRDGTYPEGDLNLTWPESGLPKLWEKTIGIGISSMAVAKGLLFTQTKHGEQDALLCLDAETGEQKWIYDYGRHYSNGDGSGARGTPTVDGDRVYAVGARGELICLDINDGSLFWKKNLIEEYQAPMPKWGISFSPLIEGDLVITQPGAPNGASVIAFDKLTGDEKWKAGDAPPSYSSPVMTEVEKIRQVIVFAGDSLLSFDPKSGEQYWKYDWKTSYSCNIATPIVRGNFVFISSGYGKGCATLEISKDKKTEKPRVDRLFYNWRMKNHFSTSVFYKDHIFGFNEAYLTCIEMKNGTVNPKKAGERRWKTGKVDKGSLILAQGHLIIYTEKGELWLVEASPEEFRPKANFMVNEGRKRWSLPVLANGRLYVRADDKLYCFNMRK